jgi:hypothetical protein
MIDRPKSILLLKAKQARVDLGIDSDGECQDEGAAEYVSELQSVVDALLSNSSDVQVLEAAEWVGQENSLVEVI